MTETASTRCTHVWEGLQCILEAGHLEKHQFNLGDKREPANLDACPRCGENVEQQNSRGIGARGEGDPLPEPNEQSATCPNCGATLRRSRGFAWALVD